VHEDVDQRFRHETEGLCPTLIVDDEGPGCVRESVFVAWLAEGPGSDASATRPATTPQIYPKSDLSSNVSRIRGQEQALFAMWLFGTVRAMEGRRVRLRADLLSAIRASALDELHRVGAAQLSLREVARLAGISPSGLYRYVDGRDALLELLITDGFEAFGVAIESAIEAAGDDLVAQLEAVALTYRRWAQANPDQFGLILGSPVPGFHARDGGSTVEGVRTFAEPMVRVVARAHAAETIDVSMYDPVVGGIPETLASVIVRAWGRIHGLVALETFGHLRWTDSDVESLLRTEIASLAVELGVGKAGAT